MSSIARFSYKNTATVRPFLGEDLENGGASYGDEFEIFCTWAASSTEERASASSSQSKGAEFVSGYTIWTEDPRPAHRDQILLNTDAVTGWQEIRDHMEWDMLFFNDTPDFRLVT